MALRKTFGNATTCEPIDDVFQRLTEAAPEGITIYQHERIVYANRAAAEQLGAESPRDVIGRRAFDFIVPADHERVAAHLRKLYDDGGQSDRVRVQRIAIDGRITDVETIAVRIEWQGRPAILEMARDIGERVLMEQRVSGLLSTGTHWLWETDAKHRFCWFSEEISRVSPAYADTLGQTRWGMLNASPDHAFWRKHVATLDANQPFDNFEYWNRLPDGGEICVSISGTPIFDANGIFQGYRGISSDITARVQAKARLEGFLETATNWLWETDADHRFTFLSAIRNDTGMKQSNVEGKTRWELVGADIDGDEHWRAHLADLDARRPFSDFEYVRPNFKPDDETRYALVSGQPVFDPSGIFMGYRGTARDITEQKNAEQTIAHMAMHDMLTQLPNRAYFTGELERACRTSKRDGTKLAVLYLDLDHFKDINDIHGHSIGDRLLIEVAKRLKSCLRGGDLVARFGGDEFVMIVTPPYDLSSIGYLADRIIKSVAAPCYFDGLEVTSGISVGVAIYPDDGLETDRVLANADLALYTAKRAGRGTWRVFDYRLQRRLQAQRLLDQQLRRALDRKQFELYYQPLINIADDQICGFEALIRWNHPEDGQVQPDAFIPAAEQNRLIIPLTEWVLDEATTQLQRWKTIGLSERKIAVNVSPTMLKLDGFVNLIDCCLARTGGDPKQLVIEITEEALIDEAKTITALMALKARGVTTALDDFGKGYSSMARLKNLPIDILKIDRSFLAMVADDANHATIVESLVNVGHGLGKKVVAEGVETAEQLRFLETIGCDVAQGFFINRPMAAGDIPCWFEQWQSSPRFCGMSNGGNADMTEARVGRI
ncbi:MAG: sensor domain-containing protein [Geminicoccales bacterium]